MFNDRGLPGILRRPSGTLTTNSFDALARLTNSSDNLGDDLLLPDGNGNVTNVVEGGRTNSWTLDAYDRVLSYRDSDGNLIQYRRDGSGSITNLVYPGNRTVTYRLDSLNRVTNVTDWLGGQTSIEYDLAGHVKKITRPNQTVRMINYDAAGQTTNIIEQTTTGAGIAFFKLGWSSSGRIAWEFGAPLPHAYSPPSRTMTFDDDNRLASFNALAVTNDLDGNMTWAPLTNNTLVSLSFDIRDRLLAAGGLQYGYDPARNRTSITNGTNITRFMIDPNAPLSQTLMRIRNGVTNYYVYGLGLLYEITETATTTNTATYHFDFRGSTVAMTDGIGRVTDRIEYSAYGMITFRTGSTDTPFLFNGRYGVQTDASGILYMRARYYNPYLCRFVNADPAGFAGGLNFYAYADGNPVSRIDPFGLGAAEPGYRSSSWFQITQSGVWGAEEGIDAMLNFGLGILFAPPGMPGPRIDPIQSLTEWATGHSAYEPSDLGGQMKQTSAELVPAGQDVLLSLGGQRPEVKPSAPVLDPKQIYPRYEYSESWKQELADYHSSDGKLFDVTGVEIKPGDYWEVGHAGPTYAERVRNAIDQAMSREEWQAQEHDVRLFRPELRYTNRSRRFQNWTGPGEQTIPGL